mmetsp:Transcript_61436/g.163506  ORF Transcript_61436/g.163506 Transcript_61436/m.163506 type:complete len:82 (+) Transcript_61436:380-625(+)
MHWWTTERSASVGGPNMLRYNRCRTSRLFRYIWTNTAKNTVPLGSLCWRVLQVFSNIIQGKLAEIVTPESGLTATKQSANI